MNFEMSCEALFDVVEDANVHLGIAPEPVRKSNQDPFTVLGQLQLAAVWVYQPAEAVTNHNRIYAHPISERGFTDEGIITPGCHKSRLDLPSNRSIRFVLFRVRCTKFCTIFANRRPLWQSQPAT